MEHQQIEADQQRSSGKRAVLAMFGFGIVMVSAMWLYWEMYTRPFRPLQDAIALAYPGSRPSVIGGRHKSHLPGNPQTLRIVVQLPEEDFDPEAEKPKSELRARELALLANQLVSLKNYEVMEIHLVQRLPEQSQRHWTVSHPVEDWSRLLNSEAAPVPPTP